MCDHGFQLYQEKVYLLLKNSFNILSPQKDKEKEEKQLEEVIVTKTFVVQVLLSIKMVEGKLISTATTMIIESVCVKGAMSVI